MMCSEALFMSPLTNDSWALAMLLSGSTSGTPVACAWAVATPAISTTTTHTLHTEDHLLIICVPPRAGMVRHNDASTYHRGGTTTLGLAREAVSLIRLVGRGAMLTGPQRTHTPCTRPTNNRSASDEARVTILDRSHTRRHDSHSRVASRW